MYSNYNMNMSGIPSSYMMNRNSSIPNMPETYSSSIPAVKTSSSYTNDDRIFAGGFLGPFILGGITGGLLAPTFNQGYGYGRPIYNNYYYPYPYYGPYYGPYYR